jgi:hypothetical protein
MDSQCLRRINWMRAVQPCTDKLHSLLAERSLCTANGSAVVVDSQIAPPLAVQRFCVAVHNQLAVLHGRHVKTDLIRPKKPSSQVRSGCGTDSRPPKPAPGRPGPEKTRTRGNKECPRKPPVTGTEKSGRTRRIQFNPNYGPARTTVMTPVDYFGLSQPRIE